MKYMDFTVINCVVELLKAGDKKKRGLIDSLSNNFTVSQVDKAIQDAVALKLIRTTGLIKSRNHELTKYTLIKGAV